jgi:hypothetical protein
MMKQEEELEKIKKQHLVFKMDSLLNTSSTLQYLQNTEQAV